MKKRLETSSKPTEGQGPTAMQERILGWTAAALATGVAVATVFGGPEWCDNCQWNKTHKYGPQPAAATAPVIPGELPDTTTDELPDAITPTIEDVKSATIESVDGTL